MDKDEHTTDLESLRPAWDVLPATARKTVLVLLEVLSGRAPVPKLPRTLKGWKDSQLRFNAVRLAFDMCRYLLEVPDADSKPHGCSTCTCSTRTKRFDA
jgi:hypothetical protein